jgi:hypothetical protein
MPKTQSSSVRRKRFGSALQISEILYTLEDDSLMLVGLDMRQEVILEETANV